MENNQLYNVFSDDNEIEKSKLTMSEVVEYANACFYYDIQDSDDDEIQTFEDAVKLFEQHGQQVVAIHEVDYHKPKIDLVDFKTSEKQKEIESVIKKSDKFALGGNIGDYSSEEFFKGLNLSALPNDVQEYIKSEILADKDLSLIDTDDETFQRIKNAISSKYPMALKDSTTQKPTTAKSEEALRYEREISDLNELISIEDDSEVISRYEKEIADLNELIELIS